MFRLKKLLYKLYHLIAFLGIFIFFISPVKADVTTCDDFLISSSIHWTTVKGWKVIDSYIGSNNWGFAVPYNEMIYLKFFPSDTFSNLAQFKFYNVPSSPDTDLGSAGSGSTYNLDNNNYTLRIPGSSLTFIRIGGNYTISQFGFDTLTEGTPLLMSSNLSDIENCTLSSSEPEPPVTDEIYSSFSTIFIDRFKYVADSCLTNPYLLAFIGVLVSWIILELFLHIIHIRGGYKK